MVPVRGIGASLIAALLAAAPLHPLAADPDATLRKLAASTAQAEPLLRIGLESGHRILLSSTTALRVIDPATGEPVWRPSFEGEIAIVADGGPTGEVPSVFRIQAGAFRTEEAARAEKSRLEKRFGAEVVVRHDPDRGNWRVRIGKADDRLALQPLMERVRQSGLRDLWIAEEPSQEYTGVRLRVVDASYDSRLTETTRLAVVSTKGERVEVEERSYRGVIELRVTSFGTVRAINWIDLEHYLLGVVPEELGPEAWPQLEALRAQAVAARTYAWRNRGQFEEEGYDLCATPRCQVYGGASSEHPLSDRAVWSTRGEILSWEGLPINAYYTATCGGHTENVESIFPGEEAPYLQGVPCRAEKEAMASFRAVLRGKEVRPVVDEAGEDVTRHWALLSVAGVLGRKAKGEEMRSPLRPEVLRSWTRSLSGLAGLPAPDGDPGAVDTLGRSAVSILDDLGWQERASVLLSEADLPALLRDPESAALAANERRALAYLAFIDGLRPFPDGTFHAAEPPSPARLLPALVRIGEAYNAFGLRSGVVSRARERAIIFVQGKGKLELPLADRPLLFGWAGGKSAPSSSLELWPGDPVRFRTNAAGKIDFLELVPPVKGASDDRSAAVYSWEVRRTRHELQQHINRRVNVGQLQDLQVVRRGVSGRVVELRVVGSEATTVVKGFDVRRLLNLRESLIVVEPQRDADGRIEAVVFAGKGWGHGVGLCQVGAYGMALRGADYRTILGHYYAGATLGKLESAAGSP